MYNVFTFAWTCPDLLANGACPFQREKPIPNGPAEGFHTLLGSGRHLLTKPFGLRDDEPLAGQSAQGALALHRICREAIGLLRPMFWKHSSPPKRRSCASKMVAPPLVGHEG